MGYSAVAGEKIAGEQKPKLFAMEAHVSMRVSRKMDGAQAMPDIDAVAIVKPAIRDERPKTEHRPADAFQQTGDPRPAPIMRMPHIMIRIHTRSGDPCAGLPRDGGHIQNVVEVPVRHNNATNRLTLPSPPSQCPS